MAEGIIPPRRTNGLSPSILFTAIIIDSPQQATEIRMVAGFFSWNRYDPDSRCLFIDHADGHFISNDGRQCYRPRYCRERPPYPIPRSRTQVIASNFSMFKYPCRTDSEIFKSSLTGINAPLRPPTLELAKAPPFFPQHHSTWPERRSSRVHQCFSSPGSEKFHPRCRPH